MISFLKNFFSNEKSTEEQALAMKAGGGCCGGGGHAHHAPATEHTHDVMKVDGGCTDAPAKAGCGSGGCGASACDTAEVEDVKAKEDEEAQGCCGGGCHR